jgi:thioredoxin 1
MQIEITNENFEQEVLKSDLPVLMDCWAPWCGPCLLIAPFVAEIAEEYAGKVKIAKFNIDEGQNSEIAAHYNILSIPTLKLFVKGQATDEIVGAVRKEMIVDMIEKYINIEANGTSESPSKSE